MSTTVVPAWASLEQASAYLSTSTKTVRRYIADGKIPAYRMGGRQTIRLRFADLDALLAPIPTGDAR